MDQLGYRCKGCFDKEQEIQRIKGLSVAMNSDLKSLLTSRDAEIERLRDLLEETVGYLDPCSDEADQVEKVHKYLFFAQPKEEKAKDFIEQFRLYFAHLARKYPERTLFTEGRDPIQDELVGLHHLAEASDTPARTEWVEKVEDKLEQIKLGAEWYLQDGMPQKAVEEMKGIAEEALALVRKTEER